MKEGGRRVSVRKEDVRREAESEVTQRSALKIEEVATGQGLQAACQRLKGKEMVSPPHLEGTALSTP